MSDFIPYGFQNISESDIRAVEKVLRSDWLTQGPIVPAFEEKLATKCNSKFAVAANSATSALHLACLALGVGPGDVVWTSPISFVASANCALYCGAKVDFVDIDPDTWCLSVELLRKKLEHHKSAGMEIPKVVIPVHLSGQSCDMQKICALGLEYGFKILEDASHAVGGKYLNERVGNCRYSDITVFSFHPVKIITTGEGGMALTNNPEIYEHLMLLRTHGITKNSKHMTKKDNAPWYYEQLELGFNYRMTDIHAALGLSQMDRLDEFVQRRNELAQLYDEALENLPLKKQIVNEETYSARHLYIIRTKQHQHRKIFENFQNEFIGVHLHYMPIHLHPFYRNLGFQEGYLTEAEEYGKEAISLPLYPSLTVEKHNRITQILKRELG